MYRHDKLNELTKEGPLSFEQYYLIPLLPAVSTVSKGHPYLVSLVPTLSCASLPRQRKKLHREVRKIDIQVVIAGGGRVGRRQKTAWGCSNNSLSGLLFLVLPES